MVWGLANQGTAPLSAVNTTLEWSSFSSLMALDSFQLMYTLVGGEFFLGTQMVSTLSSSASLGGSLMYATSVAAMYVSFGGYFGTTARFVGLLLGNLICGGSPTRDNRPVGLPDLYILGKP